MKKPKHIRTDQLLETPYIRVYDLVYEDGTHYYDASRRKTGDLAAEHEETLMADAVSAFVVLNGEEPKLLMFYEYRYPTGQYVLSIPSGLIDPGDSSREDPLFHAMIRELHEETGIEITEADRLALINPLVYCSPGFTDECTALISVVVNSDWHDHLSQAGGEGTEHFEGFVLSSRQEVLELLRKGTDAYGHPYPLVTWAAMSWFVSDMWKTI